MYLYFRLSVIYGAVVQFTGFQISKVKSILPKYNEVNLFAIIYPSTHLDYEVGICPFWLHASIPLKI